MSKAGSAHIMPRRALLSGLAATPLLVTSSMAAAPHPDAGLLEMEPVIEQIWLEADCVFRVFAKAETAYYASRSPETRAPKDEAETAYREADDRLLAACRALAKMRAKTIEGLICKARMTVHEDEMLVDSIIADLIALEARG